MLPWGGDFAESSSIYSDHIWAVYMLRLLFISLEMAVKVHFKLTPEYAEAV